MNTLLAAAARLARPFILERFSDPEVFARANLGVSAFYYLSALLGFWRIHGIYNQSLLGEAAFDPLWPIFWTGFLPFVTAVKIILVFQIFASLFGGYFFHSRLARLLALSGIFFYHAFLSSFGDLSYHWDLWVWIAAIFVLLPSVRGERAPLSFRKRYLLLFWGAQALLLLTYSMAAFWKIVAALGQSAAGQLTIFSPASAALLVAHQSNMFGGQGSFFGSLVVDYPFLGWAALMAGFYFQLFSFLAAFRPALHHLWGLGLVSFHVGVWLALGMEFFYHTPLILVLLLLSPFPSSHLTARDTLRELPLFGILFRRLLG